MMPFEHFLHKGDARQASVDPMLAASLIDFSEKGMRYALSTTNPEFVSQRYVDVYDALRQLLDALLAVHGYKAEKHMASIAFLQRFKEFNQQEIESVDNAREKRRKAEYCGKEVTQDDFDALVLLHRKLKPRLMRIIDEARLRSFR